MRAVILSFTGGRENWGCQATSFNLYRFAKICLKPLGFSKVDIVPFPPSCVFDRVEQLRHGARIEKIFRDASPSAEDLDWLEARVAARFGKMMHRVTSADLVLFQGEGAIGPTRFFRSSLLFGLPFLASRKWGKPVVSLNQTLFTENSADTSILVNILSGFTANWVRETASLAWAKSAGLEGVELHPDLAFCDMFEEASSKPNGGAYFCVTGSADLTSYSVASYSSTVRKLVETHDLDVVFLSSRSQDRAFFRQVVKRVGPRASMVRSDEVPNYKNVLPIWRNAKFVLGGRYHSSISSLSQSTPVILTPSNSHKSDGLASLLGLDIPVVDPKDTASIMCTAKVLVDDNQSSRQNVREALTRTEATLEGFRSNLVELVKRSLSASENGIEKKSLGQAFREDGSKWLRGSVPKGLQRIRSQMFLKDNLAAFDWAEE